MPEAWIDFNGQMNTHSYTDVIYDAVLVFTDFLELGEDCRNRTDCSKATVESHIIYERELKLGEQIGYSLGFWAWSKNACTSLRRLLHQRTRRALPCGSWGIHGRAHTLSSSHFPEDVQTHLQALFDQHAERPPPKGNSRRIAIASRV